MLKGIIIFALEIFAIIFVFYRVVALGGQDAMLGVALLVAALVCCFRVCPDCDSSQA